MMPSAGDRHLLMPTDEPILIELTSTRIERLRPARSRWTSLALAGFAGLTCLGLSATAVLPRLIDRAADRGGTPSAVVPSGSATTGATPPTLRPVADDPIGHEGPVTTVARLVGRSAVVRVTGVACVTVRELVVTLDLGGRRADQEVVTLDSDAAIPARPGATCVGVVHWAIDMPLPDRAMPALGDDRAIVEVRWGPSPAGPAGSDSVVVPLGDGRASG
jgi:hypothetical protein